MVLLFLLFDLTLEYFVFVSDVLFNCTTFSANPQISLSGLFNFLCRHKKTAEFLFLIVKRLNWAMAAKADVAICVRVIFEVWTILRMRALTFIFEVFPFSNFLPISFLDSEILWMIFRWCDLQNGSFRGLNGLNVAHLWVWVFSAEQEIVELQSLIE